MDLSIAGIAVRQVFSPSAEALILSFEGWDVPWKWPGQDSGITLPVGYDLGYEEHFERDWHSLLPDEAMRRLRRAIGVHGPAAAALAPAMRGIIVPRSAALQVFDNVTIPRYASQTLSVFPGADRLPSDAFGALVSLVFNRGGSLTGDRRRELKAIHDILSMHDLPLEDIVTRIAAQVRAMTRLWADNPHSDGDLHDRRMQEARLIERSMPSTKAAVSS